MGQRLARLVSVLAAGGVLSATLLAGAGAAAAAPTLATGTVSARCGGSVQASKGDTVVVTGLLGRTFSRVVSASGPVSDVVGGVLCTVQVTVKAVPSAAASAIPPLKSAAGGAVGGAVGALPGAGATTRSSPASAATTRPAPATPTAAGPAPGAPAPGSPAVAAAAASAPAFAPFFATLPASFLSSALTAPGTAARAASFGGGSAYDAGMLFGSAFPAMRAGAPFSAGFDAANAVTSTSQLQALPVDGLGGGLGVPLVLAVLVLSGMAAFAVRRTVLSRGAAAATTAPGGSGPGPDGTAAA